MYLLPRHCVLIIIILYFLFRKSFGENNVQTAKHYGNLGRLYQSMRRYEVTPKKNNESTVCILYVEQRPHCWWLNQHTAVEGTRKEN